MFTTYNPKGLNRFFIIYNNSGSMRKLISISLRGNQAQKSKVWDMIWGYQRKVGNGTYRYPGILGGWNGEKRMPRIGVQRVGKGTFIVSENVMAELQKLLGKRCKIHVHGEVI